MKKELVTELISRLTEAEKTELMEQLQPKQKFDWRSITSIEKAIERNGLSVDYIKYRDDETEDEWAYRMMKMVTKAINPENWQTKFDGVQRNYYVFWSVLSSGFGFSRAGYLYVRTTTTVGFRLYFSDIDRSKHFVAHFSDLAKKFY